MGQRRRRSSRGRMAYRQNGIRRNQRDLLFRRSEIGKYATQSTPIYVTSIMPQAFHYGYQHNAERWEGDDRWFYKDYKCKTYFCDINYKLAE